MVVGILALQGDFAEHAAALNALNVNTIFVRTITDLEAVSCLVLPGGESTVMMKLLTESTLGDCIAERIRNGMPVLATCAGAILLSDSHLGVMDITVQRNAYGRQSESFSAVLNIEGVGDTPVAFIRAPKIIRTGEDVRILATYNEAPVLVAQGSMLAATFHTETTGSCVLHELFMENCRN